MSTGTIDVQQVRDRHPIEDVVADAGVDLHRTGKGWMGRCPFHDDITASLSVGGVPDRFHCFGCGAHGDVIDFVRLRYDLPFRDAVARLEGHAAPARLEGHAAPARVAPVIPLRPRPEPIADAVVSVERGFVINELAWAHYSRPVAHAFAGSWLRHHRGIPVDALETAATVMVAGHTGHGWTSLTDHLRGQGVADAEVLAMDLAQTTRRGTLIDTLRDRLVLPVRDSGGRLTGFVGRDTPGNPRAPKYRNPTHTPTFTKATALYAPTPGPWARTTVIVEGPLDALAIAAWSALAGRPDTITAVSALGTAVTPAQADHVAAHAPGHLVIALDGDTAGIEGTRRWVDAVCRGHRRPALVTQLPDRVDPADWLAIHGPEGLAAFDPELRDGAADIRPVPAPMFPAVSPHRPVRDVAPPLTPANTPSLR